MTSTHHAGPVPVKSTNSITVSWGLVSLPLSIYAGLDDGATVTRSEFTVDGHPVGRLPYDKTTKKPYVGDVVKRVQIAPDRFVDLTDDEVELVTGGTERGRAEIEKFIPLASIGREYVVADVKQIRPAAKVPGSAKPFVLLTDTMAEAGVAALIKVTLRSVARYAAITPAGDLLLLHYADQVRPAREMPTAEISDNERQLARALLHDVVGVDTPVLVNETGVKLTEYVAKKAAGADAIVADVAGDAPVADTSLEAMLAAAVAAATKAEEVAKPAKPKAKRAKKVAA